MLNKVMLIGRLGQDPELKYTTSGMPVTNLSVATDESYTDKEGNKVDKTEWHRVVVYQRQAENCANYLGKGSLVFVEGSLQTRKWTDQQGQDRYVTEIKAQRVQFLDRRGERGEGGSRGEGGDRMKKAGNFNRRPQPNYGEEDMGSPFPSEAGSEMDKVPF
ncbi:MAG: single-stranded DNA-binding protein [Desulfovibrio sp.]|nr:single-stranded DNA-binding protein [Desulfovibrio sp.]